MGAVPGGDRERSTTAIALWRRNARTRAPTARALRPRLAVLSPDQHQIVGWVTQHDVLRTMADRIASAHGEMAQGALAAEWAARCDSTSSRPDRPSGRVRAGRGPHHEQFSGRGTTPQRGRAATWRNRDRHPRRSSDGCGQKRCRAPCGESPSRPHPHVWATRRRCPTRCERRHTRYGGIRRACGANSMMDVASGFRSIVLWVQRNGSRRVADLSLGHTAMPSSYRSPSGTPSAPTLFRLAGREGYR